MATWASSVLLSRFNDLSGRPASGDSVSDANKYVRLTDAQNAVIADAASRVPKAFYSKAAAASTPTLSTTDNKIFIFSASDLNADAMFPIGKVRIFPSLAAIPDSPWVEGVDYLNEGTQIRIPNNGTYGGTLYWRGIAPVLDISSTNQPTLIPPPFRILIVYEAVRRYALEGKRDLDLAKVMEKEYAVTFARFCLVLKTQFSNGGALGSITGFTLAELGVA